MSSAIAIVRFLHFASAMLLLALAAAPWLVAVPARDRGRTVFRRLAGPMGWALAVHLASGAAWGWLVFSEMGGASPWSPDWQRFAMGWTGTSFGRLSLWRAGIAAGFALVLLLEKRAAFSSPWRTAPLAAALLASLAGAGHAASGGGCFFLLVDGCHLLAAGIWPGGLLPLALFLASGTAEESRRAVRRFSAVSLVTVALLALSGSINSWHLLGSWQALGTTVYGRLLLIKVTLFIVMIAIGAWNLLILKPRLPDAAASTSLRRNVKAELVLGMAVVIVVAILGMTPPGLSAHCYDGDSSPPHFAP